MNEDEKDDVIDKLFDVIDEIFEVYNRNMKGTAKDIAELRQEMKSVKMQIDMVCSDLQKLTLGDHPQGGNDEPRVEDIFK